MPITKAENLKLFLTICKEGRAQELNDFLATKVVDINDKLVVSGKKISYIKCPLTYAITNGHKEIVDILITQGIDVNFKQKGKIKYINSPLYHAIEVDREDIAIAIIKNEGLNVNATAALKYGEDYRDALTHAAKRGFADAVNELIKTGRLSSISSTNVDFILKNFSESVISEHISNNFINEQNHRHHIKADSKVKCNTLDFNE